MTNLKQDPPNPMDSVLKSDVEKDATSVRAGFSTEETTLFSRLAWLRKLGALGVELRGITPVSIEDRTDKRGLNLISLWFTANFSLLPITTGVAGTASYGLSLRDSAIVITMFTAFAGIPVAWMGMAGPKTGMRQMIQARYYFGFYLVTIVILLQLATITGFTILASIISGQSLSAAVGGGLNLNVGIVITAVIGLVVSFMGYKVLHLYERYSWVPTLIALVITLGVGGNNLHLQQTTAVPSARTILSFGSIVISFTTAWTCLVSDFSVYISPEVPRTRVFSYVYISVIGTTIPLMVLGAAIGGAISNVPSLAAAYETHSIGGVIFAMLQPAGGFGKFVAVILALSVIGNVACSLYALSISFQVLLPIFARVPRFLFSILITAVIIPIAIIIASNFYDSFSNFLAVIGYWTAAFISIALTEYYYFRRGELELAIWNVGSKLPIGAAALGAGSLSFALIIPCIDTVWYTGPIGATTGDIGIEVGICISILLYFPLRTFEKKLSGR